MATSAGRGNTSTATGRKKRRTIGGFRAHAMGESFDHNTTDVTGNFSLSMVPEDQLSCLGVEGSGSEHIVVAVRVRPLSDAEMAEGKRSCCDVLTRNTLIIRKGADPGAYLRSQKGSANEYSFDAVFPPEAGQAEVYEGTARPHITELLEGINVTVFAYGATGAGKTHTMMGSERVVGARANNGSMEVSGIVPQSLVELFRLLEERVEAGSGEGDGVETWAVRVGYLQVYNEQIMDLLSPSSKPLKINEDPSKGVVVVAGLTEKDVTSSEEVLDLLRQGNANRRTEATGANQVSSRSHAVLQVVLTRTVEDGMGNKSVRESKLSLIDLAGSERASATNNRGEQLRQGANINKSLLSLANCINALAGNRRRRGGKGGSNVKYRDSKLTHLLKASLEGRCRLIMIANVNPSHVYFDDSHNTLKYANRAKNIKVDPRMTESVRGTSGLMTEKEARLAKEYQALKERNQLMEAQLESMRNSHGHIAPEPAGFENLFAPNTSSIMSVASSTPGHSDRYYAPPPPALPVPAAASGAAPSTSTASGHGKDGSGGGMKTRRSGGAGRGGGGGWAGSAMPPPAPRGETKSEWNRGVAEKEAEEEGRNGVGVGVDSGDDGCVRTPEGPSMSGGSEGLLGSGVKRKRDRDADRRVEEEAAEAERERVLAELAAERTRVRELEGKVRELESSMSRMGAQQDVNMELIDTFRQQKECAEEAAECERANADELLAMLKEKEVEVGHLRAELADVTRLTASVGEGGMGGDEENRGVGGGNSGFRSGLMMEGDSSVFGPLGQIEEDGGGGATADSGDAAVRREEPEVPAVVSVMTTSNGNNSLGGAAVGGLGGKRRMTESPVTSFPAGLSTVEVASALKSQRRKSSMIPRSRKSMIPAPRSTGRSSSARRLGDVTNSSSTRLKDLHDTPSGVKKGHQGTPPIYSCGGDEASVDLGNAAGRRSKARRASSRGGGTPQRISVAGRTRSRLSMAPACPLRDMR